MLLSLPHFTCSLELAMDLDGNSMCTVVSVVCSTSSTLFFLIFSIPGLLRILRMLVHDGEDGEGLSNRNKMCGKSHALGKMRSQSDIYFLTLRVSVIPLRISWSSVLELTRQSAMLVLAAQVLLNLGSSSKIPLGSIVDEIPSGVLVRSSRSLFPGCVFRR